MISPDPTEATRKCLSIPSREAIEALRKYLSVSCDPMISLRCLDRAMGDEMEARYIDEYNQAPDGDPTPGEVWGNQAFSAMMGEDIPPHTKGDVLRNWSTELRYAFPRAYMEDYTREEAAALLNLLNKKHVEGSVYLHLSEGFAYNIFDLMRGWNETHRGEEPISFTGCADYMP